MNCQNCEKELVGRKDKIYCSEECSRKSHNKKIVYLSRLLTTEQVKYLLELQEGFLKENKIKKLKEELSRMEEK